MIQTYANGVPWFPQEYAHEFYLVKGFLALVAVVLLIDLMMHAEIRDWGQRLRYIALLYLSVLLTASTVEQTGQDALVNYRNIGALIGTVLLIVTAGVSRRYERRK